MSVLQTAIAPYAHFDQVHPNLVLVLVLAWSLIRNIKEVLIWAFWGGFMLDILAETPFGLFTCSLIITAVLASFWQTKHFGRLLLPILLALPYSIVFNLAILIYMQLSGYTIAWRNIMTQIVFPEAMINTVAMALIFPVLIWLNKFTQKGELTI